MNRLAEYDLERLLNQPIYSWDTATMLENIVDYLEFSEQNLSWQRKREIRSAKLEGDHIEFDPPDEHLTGQYRHQLIESAEYRFDVCIAQSIRYAGLSAFITVIELCSKAFLKVLGFELTRAPDGENKNVYLLSLLNQKSSSGFEREIEDLKSLTYIRNCIVHAAGFIERYKYKAHIIESINKLQGFAIWKENYLGVSVCINPGAVELYARKATEWVPKLHENCIKIGIIKQ
ncbi:MAG: hypothetical protein EPO31_13915 [Gammaproteobacteria bacterium]|nr:MAG: hypothetical protein EPO31_13915 [Gammaproteobacteria bacterium]